MADIIQIRRDTAANWTSVNPTLAQGEMGFETDTKKLKFGDGSTAWNSLLYFAGSWNDLLNKPSTFTPATHGDSAHSETYVKDNDSRLTDARTPTNESVTPAKLASHFTDTETISGTAANWNYFRGTKTISGATTFTFSNLRIGVYMLEITGDYDITLPTGFVYAGGQRSASGAWTAMIVCTDASTPKGWYVILKDES